jgi:hypothetical protein
MANDVSCIETTSEVPVRFGCSPDSYYVGVSDAKDQKYYTLLRILAWIFHRFCANCL